MVLVAPDRDGAARRAAALSMAQPAASSSPAGCPRRSRRGSRRQFDAALNPDGRAARRARRWRAAMREADGLLCAVTDAVDAGLLARRGRRARIVANFGVGVNNIDLDAARGGGRRRSPTRPAC